jgi:predicted dehydrogenase
MQNKLRFGIIGCSTIGERSTIPAIKNSKFAELKIIGSRSVEKAKLFANKFSCKKFGSYEDVLDDKEVDAVYISLPIGLHEEWSLKAAKAGKHILCEKSSSNSYRSAQNMVQSCKENNVRIMEGFMFRFHPQHKKVLELINNGKLGELFTFIGMYGFPPVSYNDIRYNKALGGGVLNETGCYPIYASRIILNEMPIGVMCNLYTDEKTEVDIKGSSYILYDNNKTAFISFSFEIYYQANYKIWGSKGTVELKRAYAVPYNLNTTIDININDNNDKITIDAVDHFSLMIDSFCKDVMKVEPCNFSFENELLMQACIMECARISNKEKRFVYTQELL